jgi:uncharacterized protein (UPF0333 family)
MSKAAASKSKGKIKSKSKGSKTPIILVGVVILIVVISVGALLLVQKSSTSVAETTSESKPIILYVNQGNALVDTSNFTTLLNFAKENGFNTIFFQVYRSGNLLFSESNLTYFVDTVHLEKLKIFFALYFTASNQLIPTSIYGLGEDGINLDMSTLNNDVQANLLATLQQNYKGQTSVTTTNFTTSLRPDLLILETYQAQNASKDIYIHSGIIASVEPLSMSSKEAYQSQFQYDLINSDGVMVFDYYGLLKTGY